MRNLFKYLNQTSLLLFLGIAVSLTGCKKDDDGVVLSAPKITVTSDTNTYFPGDTVAIEIDIVAHGKLKEVVVGNTTITTFKNEIYVNDLIVPYVIPTNSPSGLHEVIITATDKQNPPKSKMAKAIIFVRDPNECTDPLSGCSAEGKTWVLKQGEGALSVAPEADHNMVWWSSPPEAVTERACMFNDEWVFKSNGTVLRTINNDFFVDEEYNSENAQNSQWPRDMPNVGCHSITEIPVQYQAWGDGNFTYSLSGGDLIIVGEGAYVGMYKVGDTELATTTPNAKITYKVESITENELVISKSLSGVYWKFVLQPKQ